jgi:hypothetical protein
MAIVFRAPQRDLTYLVLVVAVGIAAFFAFALFIVYMKG